MILCRPSAPRRRATGTLLVLTVVLLFGAGLASAGEPAGDGSGPAPTNEVPDQVPGGGIIPAPDSGEAPDSPGDRGGWAQLGLLAVLVGGLGVMVALVVRSARRAPRDPSPQRGVDGSDDARQ